MPTTQANSAANLSKMGRNIINKASKTDISENTATTKKISSFIHLSHHLLTVFFVTKLNLLQFFLPSIKFAPNCVTITIFVRKQRKHKI